jgi:hypothetical protein
MKVFKKRYVPRLESAKMEGFPREAISAVRKTGTVVERMKTPQVSLLERGLRCLHNLYNELNPINANRYGRAPICEKA